MGKDYCCVHKGNGQVVKHSLALRKEKGLWVITPVCLRCRGELIRQAKAEGKYIPFYGIENSEAEVIKRNQDVALTFKPFLTKFGRDRNGTKPKPA